MFRASHKDSFEKHETNKVSGSIIKHAYQNTIQQIHCPGDIHVHRTVNQEINEDKPVLQALWVSPKAFFMWPTSTFFWVKKKQKKKRS